MIRQQENIISWHGQLRVKPAQALILFVCWWILAWVLGSVIIAHTGIATTGQLRMSTIIQDVVMFVLPTVMTMLLIAQRPWRIMGLDSVAPKGIAGLGIAALLASIPWMNVLVLWNQNIHFPEALSSLEQVLRDAETTAEAMVSSMMGNADVPNLIISIAIVGLLTGIAEELFFRGGLQQLLTRLSGNIHVAIWVTAFIFSAIHMQFFGFFPRLLMGAFFGYLFYWGRSLWLPVAAHALNNSIVVYITWLANRGNTNAVEFETLGTEWQLCLASVIVTSFLVWRLVRHSNRMQRHNNDR